MGAQYFRMKKLLLFSPIVLVFILFLAALQRPDVPTNRESIRIGSQELTVEVAKTDPEITLGLGERDSIGSDGMLFVLPTRIVPTFWMKNMRFDLDFVWIDGDTVIDITENVSAQNGEPDSKLSVYSPRSPATHVLEMDSGAVQKLGIRIGDKASL
jgi:uncharacterized membrane protein (UPF0127 family)